MYLQRKLSVFSIVLLALAFVVGVYGFIVFNMREREERVIGGDRDRYGCLIGAGYTFDEEVGACIRAFDMTPDIRDAARLAVEYVGKGYGLTIVSFNSYEEVGAYDIMLGRGVEPERTTILIRNWRVESVVTE